MSDMQNELAVAPDAESYPVILDLVTDEQLSEGQRAFRKEKPLSEGAFANGHNAWKREQVRSLLENIPDAETFVCVARVVAAANNQLQTKPDQNLGEATMEAVAALLRGSAPAAAA